MGWIRRGSPPLTRGKGIRKGKSKYKQGITPAYAGKSRRLCRLWAGSWDHPRLRGEKFSLISKRLFRSGSPPLTRGKGSRETILPVSYRITPAYAGKRSVFVSVDHSTEDHPRLRGEKFVGGKVAHGGRGSPPLTRGKAAIPVCFIAEVGITPAYAGKRMVADWRHEIDKDHPRLRGEKVFGPFGWQRTHERITPAYAGKSHLFGIYFGFGEDHPRLRGEKFFGF